VKQAECRRARTGLAADFDGVVFGAAIIGAEDVQPTGLCGGHRQAGRNDRRQRRKPGQIGAIGLRQHGQRVFGGQGRAVGDADHQHGRQQLRRFCQRKRGALQIGRAIAVAGQRAFHGHIQIVSRIGNGDKPAQISLVRHRQAGNIAVIGAGFQGFGTAGGEHQFGIAKRAKGGKAAV